MRKISIIAALILLFAGSAEAVPIYLGPITEAYYDQQDSPCIIGYSCGPNLGVDYYQWSNPTPAEGTVSSPLYDGAQLTLLKSIVGNTPLIAIDINQDGRLGSDDSKYTIGYIKVFFNGETEPAYEFLGPETVPQTASGNGDSDYVIPGLDLSGATTSLQFEFKYGNDSGTIGDNNDGKEILFLVKAGTPQVPEPGTLMLLGFGLLGLWVVRRKK